MCRVSIAFKSIAGLGSRLLRLGDPMLLMKESHRVPYTVSRIVYFVFGNRGQLRAT